MLLPECTASKKEKENPHTYTKTNCVVKTQKLLKQRDIGEREEKKKYLSNGMQCIINLKLF